MTDKPISKKLYNWALGHSEENKYPKLLCVNENAGLEIWYQIAIRTWLVERSMKIADTEWVMGLPKYYQREIIEEWK